MLTPQFLNAILGTPTHPAARNPDAFNKITSDSRKILKGDVFIAVKGEKMDGHDYIPQAIEKGAKAILTEKPLAAEQIKQLKQLQNVSVYTVPNTTDSYRKIGFGWRRQFKIPVIAVAGSVGKTTTKEFIAAILSGPYGSDAVLKTIGSQNGFLGIPMTLTELRPHHRFAVIEVGIDEPGTMQGHIEGVNPTHTILTRIGPEHMEKLLTLETVAHEEGLAFQYTLKSGGAIVINHDDPWVQPWEQKAPIQQRMVFSIPINTVHSGEKTLASQDQITPNISGTVSGDVLKVTGSDGFSAEFKSPLPGAHNFENLLGAISLGRLLGLDASTMQKGLSTFQSAPGRSKVETDTKSGACFFIDTYNANPSSMAAALKTVYELSTQQQKPKILLCLGDMLELGENEIQFHEELLSPIQEIRPVGITLYGPRMKKLAVRIQNTLPQVAVLHSDKDHGVLADFIRKSLDSDTIVLFKGSRGMKMETVVEHLKQKK